MRVDDHLGTRCVVSLSECLRSAVTHQLPQDRQYFGLEHRMTPFATSVRYPSFTIRNTCINLLSVHAEHDMPHTFNSIPLFLIFSFWVEPKV